MRLFSLLFVLGLSIPSSAIPYDQYILAPKSRTLHPVFVHSSNGSVSGPENLTTNSPSNSTTVFTDESATAYDFSINIAGIVTLDIASVSDANQYIGVTFPKARCGFPTPRAMPPPMRAKTRRYGSTSAVRVDILRRERKRGAGLGTCHSCTMERGA
jgi:hypothetical protein